jgi:hypothetical protein
VIFIDETNVIPSQKQDLDFIQLYFLVDGLSDIFSLGVIVCEMAAGNRPCLGESLATISNRSLSQRPYGRSRFWLPIAVKADEKIYAIAKKKLKPQVSRGRISDRSNDRNSETVFRVSTDGKKFGLLRAFVDGILVTICDFRSNHNLWPPLSCDERVRK